jgi:hypothetical protein
VAILVGDCVVSMRAALERVPAACGFEVVAAEDG